MNNKKYKIINLILIIYVTIILILNYVVKSLNLTYVLFSIIILNWGVQVFYDYKNEKNNINFIALMGSIIAFLGLLILML